MGGKPTKLPIEGAEHAIVSDNVLDLPERPQKMAIVGGGYIAVEFSGIFNNYGTDVHLIFRQVCLDTIRISIFVLDVKIIGNLISWRSISLKNLLPNHLWQKFGSDIPWLGLKCFRESILSCKDIMQIYFEDFANDSVIIRFWFWLMFHQKIMQ